MLWIGVDEREPDPTLLTFCPERAFFSTSLKSGKDSGQLM